MATGYRWLSLENHQGFETFKHTAHLSLLSRTLQCCSQSTEDPAPIKTAGTMEIQENRLAYLAAFGFLLQFFIRRPLLVCPATWWNLFSLTDNLIEDLNSQQVRLLAHDQWSQQHIFTACPDTNLATLPASKMAQNLLNYPETLPALPQ